MRDWAMKVCREQNPKRDWRGVCNPPQVRFPQTSEDEEDREKWRQSQRRGITKLHIL